MMYATASFFDVLQTTPMLGRVYSIEKTGLVQRPSSS
jgi:hypothetical protein